MQDSHPSANNPHVTSVMKTPPSFPELPDVSALDPLPRRAYHNAYPCLVRGKRGELAKNRDAAAFTEMMSGLGLDGYRFESIIFNYALAAGAKGTVGIEDLSFVRSGDLLVMVTRPPLHDLQVQNRKYVPRSGTRLEQQIFGAVSRFLEICSRTHLRLQEEVVKAWEQGMGSAPLGERIQTPADFKFCQNCDARLKSLNTLDLASRARRLDYGRDYRSIGCFIHVPFIEEFGCRLIVSFGMAGMENLIWNRIVRTRYDRWLKEPVFALAEMNLNRIPKEPVTLNFVDEIPVKVLVEIPVDQLMMSPREVS